MSQDPKQLSDSARRVLDEPAFTEAVRLAQARIFSDWSRAQSTGERERLFAEFQALDRLESSLRALFAQGFTHTVSR